LNLTLESNSSYGDSVFSFRDIKNNDDEAFVLKFNMINMPQGSSYSIITRSNAEVTTSGL
jgi:hypothetical protein